MKLAKFLGGLAMTAVLGAGLASCSNEMEPSVTKSDNMLLKAPKAMAYAGNQKWDPFSPGFAGTRGSNAEANRWADQWDCPHTEANDLTAEELKELKELLSMGKETYCDFVFPYENYWVQQIYKGEDVYTPTDKFGNECNGQSILGSGNMDHFETARESVSNFNYGDNKNNPGNCQVCGRSLAGTTLMLDVKTNFEPGTQYDYWESYGSHLYNNYYIVEYKGYYYLGFDYEMHKQANNPGEVADVERDWNFTDWIVRIVPAYPKGETPADNPGGIIGSTNPGPETPETPDPDPDPETPEIPEVQIPDVIDPGFAIDPEKPAAGGAVAGEVEVNLALDEKEDGDVRSSHLSIHIRKATDVEIFIPVPRQYYCEADDMAIVMQHEANHMAHGGPYEFTWTLKDSDLQVSLFVQYEDDGIRIWTDGVNQDVIDWCYEKCQDGITFEVWNYFNDPEGYPLLSAEELRQYLDQATIKFLDEVPDHYVNAFADPNGKYDADTNPGGNDFHVTPVNPEDFDAPYEGPHQNNSNVNDIYTKNDVPEQPSKPTPPPVPVY